MRDSHDEDIPDAVHTTRATTLDDGRIEATFETNDNLDRGYPTEFATWKDTFKSLDSFARTAGFTRTGALGAVVDVELDGVDFTRKRYEQLQQLQQMHKRQSTQRAVGMGMGF
jgi:hypothetical protein